MPFKETAQIVPTITAVTVVAFINGLATALIIGFIVKLVLYFFDDKIKGIAKKLRTKADSFFKK